MESSHVTDGLDGHGHVYSANQFIAWNKTWNNIPFTIGEGIYVYNVVSGAGQIIALPAGKFSSLRMLGTAVNGQQASQEVTVTYTDGTTTAITQSLSDWHKPQSFSGGEGPHHGLRRRSV